MKLVIAEKHSVGENIARVLNAAQKKKGYIRGGQYIVSWCVGHLIELSPPEAYGDIYARKPWTVESLPVIPDKWQFSVIDKTKSQYDVLKSLMNSPEVDELICATDAGREGECIFRYIYFVSGCRKPVKRLWISSVEDDDIREGFRNLKNDSDYNRLFDSGYARAQADWLVGMNFTRLFSAVYSSFLSVGRVQTPTLNLIVNRENEINSFAKKKYFTVTIDCGEFKAHSDKIENYEEADRILKAAENNIAFIKSVCTEKKKAAPPKLLDLTSLQKIANRLFGYTAQQTLNYAQGLYESKLITYPRTDSRYVTNSMEDKIYQLLDCVKDNISFAADIDFIPNVKTVINDSKVTDHHALLPTLSISNDDVLDKVPESELKILYLICAQLIYAVSPAHEYENTTAVLECSGYEFTAKGKRITSFGWKKYQQKIISEISDKSTSVNDLLLPDIAQGLVYENIRSELNEHWTSPPKRFTDDTLISAMENAGKHFEAEHYGLGSPATRSGIIETIIKRGFVLRSGKNLVPTSKGISLIQAVPEEIRSPMITAQWEDKLRSIENGQYSPVLFLAEITAFVSEIVEKYGKNKTDLSFKAEKKIIGKCPKCGKNVVEFLKGYGCENGKNGCGFVIWKNISGITISEKAVSMLIKFGISPKIKGFKKKDGSGTFSAFLVLNDDFSLSFKFK